MSKPKPEARIVITRGQRADCKATLDVFMPRENKLQQLGTPCGPLERDIHDAVRKLAGMLERAGNVVTFVER